MPEQQLDGAQQPWSVAFCPDCGQKADGNAFCVACGTSLRGLIPGVPQQTVHAVASPPASWPVPPAAQGYPTDSDDPFALLQPRPEEVTARWYGPAPAAPAVPAMRAQQYSSQPHGLAVPPQSLLPHGWVPASFLQRVGARVVDALVVLTLCIGGWALLAAVIEAGSRSASLGNGLALLATVLLLPTVVSLAYYVLSDSGSGRSVGRAALGIRLVRLPAPRADEPLAADSVETRVGVGTAIGRLLVTALGDSLFWLGSLSVLWNPQRRSWADRATDTAVVVDRHGERQSALLPVLVSAVLVGIASLGGAALTRGSTPVQEAGYGTSTNYSDSPSSPGTAGSDGSSAPDNSSAPSDVPISAGESDVDTWVAQLASVPIGDNAQLQAQYRSIAVTIPDVRVVSSNSFASLTPGYWMLYHPGNFSDGAAAVGYCGEQGRSIPQNCFGRYLSHDLGDAKLLCYGTSTAASEEACSRHYRP